MRYAVDPRQMTLFEPASAMFSPMTIKLVIGIEKGPTSAPKMDPPGSYYRPPGRAAKEPGRITAYGSSSRTFAELPLARPWALR